MFLYVVNFSAQKQRTAIGQNLGENGIRIDNTLAINASMKNIELMKCRPGLRPPCSICRTGVLYLKTG